MRTSSAVFLLATLFLVAPSTAQESDPTPATQPCEGGVVLDDGQVDSGYSFVPSSQMGIYVQYFDSALFSRRELQTVCVCWLKTRQDRKDVPFEVVFFEKIGNQPAREPYAWVSGEAKEVADSVKTAGAFVDVDVRGVSLPKTGAYIGVRWNPSEEQHLFLCNDRSEATTKTEVRFHDDRSRGWGDVKTARDPIFHPHRAVMVRAKALGKDVKAPPPWKPPSTEESPGTPTTEPKSAPAPEAQPSGG